MKLEFSPRIFEKYSYTKFHVNPPSVSCVFPSQQTDIHCNVNSSFFLHFFENGLYWKRVWYFCANLHPNFYFISASVLLLTGLVTFCVETAFYNWLLKEKERGDRSDRRGRRRRKLLDDLKERRRYCHLKEEALDRTMWRASFGRGFGPVVRQTTKWMTVLLNSDPEGYCIYWLP